MVNTAHTTAPTAYAGPGKARKNKGRTGPYEVINNDFTQIIRVRWSTLAFVVSCLTALGVVGGAVTDHLVREARREGFAAGEARGACRIWTEALRSNPALAITPDGKALNVKCAAVLNTPTS